jgi:DNA-binding response OmpR family regulator
VEKETCGMRPTLVCVIDENDSVRDLVCRALQGAGFTTIDARNGIVGVRESTRMKPAVVVTDMVMEHCNGIETILALKRKMPRMRILAISDGGESAGRDLFDLARSAGADDCLKKPFPISELVSKVTNLAQVA